MARWQALVLGIGLCVSCAGTETPPAAPAKAPEVPLFEGLGSHHRKVTTTSADAQRYFDQGLAFLYGFNHDEAIRAFRQAAAIDPSCAMAHWGIAYANGPHINNPVVPPEREKAAYEAVAYARKHVANGTATERALVEALAKRYAWPQPEDRASLDRAFADAMRAVFEAHPEDADVGAIYAEALMDLHPWDLWNHDGTPKEWTPEIVALLEDVLEKSPDHPLALHLYIHAVEASNDPARADAAANRLRDLVPGVGHLVHMPSHIDVRRGRWEEAIVANTKAMASDHDYRDRVPEQGFYRLYMAHNHHMRAFAAMMVGKSELALASVREMVEEMPAEWLRENAGFADGFVAMPVEVLMRFGRWEEILAEPEPPDYLPLTRALRHYARGVAFAATGRIEAARAEETAFEAARAKVSPEAVFGNNASLDILGVAEKLLAGEILYQAGQHGAGLAALREAVAREDALRYDEPPDWIQPIRHALGAALLRSGEAAEAERVFREDLERLPGNGWSLYGLGRALRLQKKEAEAAEVEARFAEVWKEADVKIASSCLCLSGV